MSYHELSEFFLAWDRTLLQEAFPNWSTDSKRAFAVQGKGRGFNESMVEIYRNLCKRMPDNGYQVVMFTHQDPKVWADLTMILWKSGLHVVSAWNIATETNSRGLKQGNYVKGTVILVLKKQSSEDVGFNDEVLGEIEEEVEAMLQSMRDLETQNDPDFSDPDYILAAYAASLKVLTSYKSIHEIDSNYWLLHPFEEGNPVHELIQKAKELAYNLLTPERFEPLTWQSFSKHERFYIMGLDLEMENKYCADLYQKLARGFGISHYKSLITNLNKNRARLKTPAEFRRSVRENEGFGDTLLRHVLNAINETRKTSTTKGLHYLNSIFNKNNAYKKNNASIIIFLKFIQKTAMIKHMTHWKESAHAAKLLHVAFVNDGL